MRSVFLAVLAAFVLIACGGGGAASSDTTTSVIDGKLKSGLIVASDADAAATGTTASTDGTGLVLSNPTGELRNLKSGQVVVLPANDSQGLPMGYTGVAQVQSDGTVKLEPASLGDVFNTLNVDFDSERSGGQIAGLIVPNNSKMSASIKQPSYAQTGLDFATCQLGLQAVLDVKCENGALEGSIVFESPILVKAADGSGKKPAKIYGRIDLKKLSTKVKIDFDAIKYASTGGINIMKAEMTGEWGASSGIKLEDDSGTLVEISSWSELVRDDAANIWDENTKIKAGKFFELSGLAGDDKKGLIPIGGIYIAPTNAARGGQPFSGDLSATQLGRVKGLGTIFWLYLDMSGSVKISGDFKFFDVTGGGFNKGFKLERVNGSLSSEIINTNLPANVYSPRVSGRIEASQTVGADLALDVMVAGIRPATVKTTLIGAKAVGSIEGDGGLKWYPGLAGWEGNLCFNLSKSVFSDFVFRAEVNAKIEAGWVKAKGGYAYKYEPDPAIWWQSNFTACANTYSLPVALIEKAVDTNDPAKTKINMSFSGAYNNAGLCCRNKFPC